MKMTHIRRYYWYTAFWLLGKKTFHAVCLYTVQAVQRLSIEMKRKHMHFWSNPTCHPANSTSFHLVVPMKRAPRKSRSDRIGSRTGSGIGTHIMDRIMLSKIRNCAWQAKIKSAWYNRAQAPLDFFFSTKTSRIGSRIKKKLKQSKRLQNKKKGGGREKIKWFPWKLEMLLNKPK